MDEIIKCGDFSISDFLKEKEFVDDLENKEKQVQTMIEVGFKSGLNGLLHLTGDSVASSRYPKIDTRLFQIAEPLELFGAKIMVPRFGIIDMNRYLKQIIEVSFISGPVAEPSRVEVELRESPDNNELTDCIFKCITEEAKHIDYSKRAYLLRNNGYTMNLMLKMQNSGYVKTKKRVKFILECKADFLLPDKAVEDIAMSKKWLCESTYSLIVDNHIDGWSADFTKFHSFKNDENMVKKSTKKYQNVLVIASYLDKHYLITNFDPVYRKVKND